MFVRRVFTVRQMHFRSNHLTKTNKAFHIIYGREELRRYDYLVNRLDTTRNQLSLYARFLDTVRYTIIYLIAAYQSFIISIALCKIRSLNQCYYTILCAFLYITNQNYKSEYLQNQLVKIRNLVRYLVIALFKIIEPLY